MYVHHVSQALTNAIAFAQHNFENENERNYIMQVGRRGRRPWSLPCSACTWVPCLGVARTEGWALARTADAGCRT